MSSPYDPPSHSSGQRAEREDLMREATALVPRVEFILDQQESVPLIAGLRRDGSLSLFCGEDPVFQFNAQGQLRRGYFNGTLIKAERGRLIQLVRHKTSNAVALMRHEFSDAETTEFLTLCEQTLATIAESIATAKFRILRQVPEDAKVMERLSACIAEFHRPIPIAKSPRVGG